VWKYDAISGIESLKGSKGQQEEREKKRGKDSKPRRKAQVSILMKITQRSRGDFPTFRGKQRTKN